MADSIELYCKTRQADFSGTIYWPILTANEAWCLEGVGYHIGGGVVQYKCFVGCRLPPLDGYVAVCLVLTIDVYAITKLV